MKLVFLSIAFALAVSSAGANNGFVPTAGFVPDARTAEAIARAVLIPIYGEGTVRAEEPLRATRHGDEWHVNGTLQCAPHCVGGTAFVSISAKDGRILSVFHGK